MRERLRQIKQAGQAHGWRAAHALGLASRPHTPVRFVVEKADWSIRWDGEHTASVVNSLCGRPVVEVSDAAYAGVADLVHFGSQYMWLDWAWCLPARNDFAVSFFHGKPEDGPEVERHIERFLASVPRLRTVVTAASLVENRLLQWGVPRDKLVRIPIGVDTSRFQPPTSVQRAAARARFGFTDDRIVIGSFQKDGNGWGEGLEPKLIKGPDLFVDAVARLARDLPVSVLLTGPARGYVRRELESRGIPHSHIYLDDQSELAACYHALDMYLVTSREEGGPKGVMEAMASGIPLVSTCVGMAPDLVEDGRTGALATEFTGACIAGQALRLLQRPDLPDLLVRAREASQAADWQRVGRLHWELVYAPVVGGSLSNSPGTSA